MPNISKPALCITGALALLLSAPQLEATHGGRFAPPGAATPPNTNGTIPHPRGSSTPRSSVPAPITGGRTAPVPMVPSAAPLQAGAVSLTGGANDAADLSEWTWWWHFNREPYLALKDHIDAGRVMSGSVGYSGSGGQEFAWQEVLPAFVQILGAPQSAKISADELTATLISLARIIRDAAADKAQQLGALRALLSQHLNSSNQEVSETAVIALGIAGGQHSSLLLSELLSDSEAARKLLGKTSVPARTRSFAAYALALLGANDSNEDLRRLIVHRLMQALDADDTSSADLQVACVIALGRVPLKLNQNDPDSTDEHSPASSSLQAQLSYLLAKLNAKELKPYSLAHIPTSLGALLPGETSELAKHLKQSVGRKLLDLLHPSSKASNEIQQSAMIALGMIGDDDIDAIDIEIRKLLDQAWSSFKDHHTRHMATIALAQISTRRGSAEHTREHLAQSSLIRKLSSRREDEVRWAALALGLHGRERTLTEDFQDPINSIEPIAEALARCLRDAGSPLDVGALATSLGLLGSPLGMQQLEKQLNSTTDDRALGHLAVGAGLLNMQASRPALQAWIRSSSYRIFLTQELAIALALLEDRSVAPWLVERLATASSLTSQATLAQALGRVGDKHTLEPLLALLKNQEVSSQARAFAAVALGIVVDQKRLPWSTPLMLNINYMASTDTLFNHRGNGVLNIF